MLERKWWTLIAVCVAIFMLLLDITIVNVALPNLARSLHASFTDLQWVVDAYALALATCVLNAGSLADLLGRKRVFTLGLALFTAASLLCGLATSPLFLILARARIRKSGDVASPQRSEAAVKSASPRVKTRFRPSRSASEPALSTQVASASA